MTREASSQGTERSPITLLILGAGCSVGYGYPCAKDMVSQLKEFAATLGEGCLRLRQLVHQTIGTFDRLQAAGAHAQTLDDLAWLVHQGKLADRSSPAGRLHNYHLVDVAKVVVAALFLFKESEAAKTGLPAYRTLLRRILSSDCGTDFRSAANKTPYRVLTFNYDRLFELAYSQHFEVDRSQAFYGPTGLNSGLFQIVPEQVEVDRTRFSFLKLHGSVGIYGHDDGGECQHIHTVPDPANPVPLKDERFFYPDDHPLYRGKPNPPLIVFPHEKDHLREYPSNRFSYRVYIPEIWAAAREFAAQAHRIQIIGYSCPEPDLPALRSLIEAAVNCEHIVIQNPVCANAICDRMKMRFPRQAELFKPYDASFEDG